VGMPGHAGSDLDLRQPMNWEAVAAQQAQPESILSWCKYLIQARQAYPALRGDYATLATDVGSSGALAYLRSAGTEQVVVVANLTDAPETVVVKGLKGLPPDAVANPVIGKAGGPVRNGSFTAAGIPPHGLRVYHAGGGTFKGNIHGDLQ